jgi:hypothetical protein
MKCSNHSYRNILYYAHQNTCIKLLRECDFEPVNILVHKEQLYTIKPNIFPKLLNIPEMSEIIYKTRSITPEMVLSIITNRCSITFPFNINIYTSYTYLSKNSKALAANMIGQYTCEPLDDDGGGAVDNCLPFQTVHIFITPNLAGDKIYMHELNINSKLIFQKESIFANRPLQEGNKTSFHDNTHTEKALNNLHCVCDHPKTEIFFPPQKYKNLGNNNNNI